MKSILILFLFVLVACGGPERSQNSSSSSGEGLQDGKEGILSIPAPGIVGGSYMIHYNNKDYPISSELSSSTAYNTIQMLANHQIAVYPILKDNYSTNYRVRFVGVPTTGKCPFNPMAQCEVIKLQSIQAY